ncbi:hypothetical protein M3079_01130 [Phascolarctobacterium sp. ET69]|uniref:hypothetical protein n=1 Tax=Phascolarctobacterium sp. ET69 TaxID=2939420 RepID=UPI0020115AD3|nr:hypothetical protein [Phascolarctobacterium sp. ET69]MCL1604588.1 hypothetical protein [Phascolarctobacterium sp. ET69]
MKKEEIKIALLNMINEIKCEKGDDKIKDLDDSLLLRNDLNLDSFDLAILTAKIEDKYNIDVFEDRIVKTVGEIIIKLEK